MGGGTSEEIETLRTYGINVGIAFQIQDDVLDIVGNPEVPGKPVGAENDHPRQRLRAFKNALPSVRLWRSLG